MSGCLEKFKKCVSWLGAMVSESYEGGLLNETLRAVYELSKEGNDFYHVYGVWNRVIDHRRERGLMTFPVTGIVPAVNRMVEDDLVVMNFNASRPGEKPMIVNRDGGINGDAKRVGYRINPDKRDEVEKVLGLKGN